MESFIFLSLAYITHILSDKFRWGNNSYMYLKLLVCICVACTCNCICGTYSNALTLFLLLENNRWKKHTWAHIKIACGAWAIMTGIGRYVGQRTHFATMKWENVSNTNATLVPEGSWICDWQSINEYDVSSWINNIFTIGAEGMQTLPSWTMPEPSCIEKPHQQNKLVVQ